MAEDDIVIEKSEGIATVVLNRPDRLNALTQSMMREDLPRIWTALERDSGVRVVIFTGAGERAFCAGMDVKEAADASDSGPTERGGGAGLLTARQNRFSKPVITAVNGVCAGGGLMFVSDCDIALAADHATFFNPGVSVGQLATYGAVTWTRWVPFQALMRMTLVGSHERISAQRALELGLVTEVVPGPSLLSRARAIAAMISTNSPTAVRLAKRILWEALDRGLTEAHANGMRIMREYVGHPDSREGPRAFAEKRAPRWSQD
jgi:enoyl-CoA hydratase/carnithine racemase